MVLPDERNLHGVLGGLLGGAMSGLFIGGPLVIIAILVNRFDPYLRRHSRSVNTWTSRVMLISFGYYIGCSVGGVSDQWIPIAVFAIGLCAFIRASLDEAIRTPSNPPPPRRRSEHAAPFAAKAIRHG